MHFRNCAWFTNLDHKKRHASLDLRGNYYCGNEDMYPLYDNYDAINVDKVADIPCDYMGKMGVPITFFDKYCPEQFEIIGLSGTVGAAIPADTPRELRGGVRFYLRNGDGSLKRCYDRVVIRRKRGENGD